ncbi:hypothetical protein AMATHDRAFT_116853, partial [Amanita thiersii Skay4041]
VQFQIPQFMYTGPPTLAPGGGAEVLPPGMFSQADTLTVSWFTNNTGFSPDNACLSSSFRSHLPSEHPPAASERHARSNILQTNRNTTIPGWPSHLSPQLPLQVTAHNPNAYLDLSHQLSFPERNLMAIGEASNLSAPSPLGLPVYSATGFDVLSILARVATRPNPRVVLGPVDLTCSFVVVDIRRHDQPIVYCSPSFCRLTGYSESEVLGRNCRFLQSPNGQVNKGEERRFTSPEAVAHFKKHLIADKECQTSIVNYRKDGSAFINLVTVIPIGGGESGLPHEENEVVYHVGFQVDLTEQPNVILQKLRDGSYMVNYSAQAGLLNSPVYGGSATSISSGAKKAQSIAQPLVSKDLKKLLADTDFVSSIPISSSTTVPQPLSASSAEKADQSDSNQGLNLILLESCPDFLHVVSLKGSFLYVAPSVRRVLGYEPEEMVGSSIADISHPEDIVPLMRELKESSSTGISNALASTSQDGHTSQQAQITLSPRTVDLLFRARTKSGVYVWVECRGRLHVEPGKGRKAIILSGRAREMPKLSWENVKKAGGLIQAEKITKDNFLDKDTVREQSFWSMVSSQGTFVVVGSSIKSLLGWEVSDLIGRPIGLLLSHDDASGLSDEIRRIQLMQLSDESPENHRSPEFVRVRSRLRRSDGGIVDAVVVLYQPIHDALLNASPMPAQSVSPSHIISHPSSSAAEPRMDTNVFEELETSRGSSWQYELQQLKYTNQRLMDEVKALEAQLQAGMEQTQQGEQPQHFTAYSGSLDQQQHVQPSSYQ